MAASCLLSIDDMALIVAARKLRMDLCFFPAVDVPIATRRVEVELAISMRGVAVIRRIEADPTTTPVVFFARSLAG